MSLTLKKDLVITDPMVANALESALVMGYTRGFHEMREDRKLVYGYPLPSGPLHPIAALAFGMAGFLLKCAKSGQRYTANEEGRWLLILEGPNGYESAGGDGVGPWQPVIVGHLDPEVV